MQVRAKKMIISGAQETHAENAILRTIFSLFKDLWNVLWYNQNPTKISLVYVRNCLRFFRIMPHIWKQGSQVYKVTFKFFMAMMLTFAVSITCDLYEASQDILQFGEDLVILIGIYLVIFKLTLSAYYANDIERIIYELDQMHKYFSQLQKSPSIWKIHKLQRRFFVCEVISFFFYIILSILFTAVLCLCPIIINSGGTPYRAKFPFDLNTYSENPILFSIVYIFQSVMTLFTLLSIVLIDNLGCHIFTQTTVNLKILCIRIRELGSLPGSNYLEELHHAIKLHQYIISLIDNINHVYYYNYASQMAASTLMICLTAFEAMLARREPLLAIKFQIYMFSAFAQLFYWCGTGNLVYYNSIDIAEAAYEIDGWYEQNAEFVYCLRFLIKRAQTPLSFRPKPLFCFNFDSFVSILSTSYSYFALLRTMND